MALPFKLRSGILGSVDCSDWNDFHGKVHSYLRQGTKNNVVTGNYIFRGQSCSSWGLRSSFDRNYSHLSPAEADEVYYLRLKAFQRNYRMYGDLASDDGIFSSTDVEKLTDGQFEALAQHFGLPTRLLDWTTSLYVAAFFAFSKIESCTSGMVSIWAMSLETPKHFSKDHIEHIQDFYRGNIRNLWQLGSFIRNKTNEKELDKLFREDSLYYSKGLNDGSPFLTRFDIPKDEIKIAIDDLNMMRINSMTIFPGIEGVVKWIDRGGFAILA